MNEQPEYDPVFLNSRREAIVIFFIWFFAMLWTVPYCYLNGFTPLAPGESIATVMGIPSWVFWGIGVPWLIADVLTIAFCIGMMKDDDLGPADDELTAASNAEEGASA